MSEHACGCSWGCKIKIYDPYRDRPTHPQLISKDKNVDRVLGEANRWKQYWDSTYTHNPNAISIDIFTFGDIQMNPPPTLFLPDDILE